jgi:hypothetical protein
MSYEPENSGDWFTSPIRTIIKEPLFEQQLSGLAVSYRRIEAVLRGIKHSLEKAPEQFEKVPDTPYCVVKTNVYRGAPAIRIFFTYTRTEVHLEAVEFAEDNPPERDEK